MKSKLISKKRWPAVRKLAAFSVSALATMALPVLAFALFVGAHAANSQALPWQKTGAPVAGAADHGSVRYEYPEQVTVAPGKPAIVQMHFRVAEGMHINSHKPLQKSLIRTELIVVEPPGVKFSTVDFPAGSAYALKAMPSEKLDVYTGEFVVAAHIIAQPGEHLVQAELRYQACDSDTCFPPRMAPVALDVVGR